jgi:hypothetical protein
LTDYILDEGVCGYKVEDKKQGKNEIFADIMAVKSVFSADLAIQVH